MKRGAVVVLAAGSLLLAACSGEVRPSSEIDQADARLAACVNAARDTADLSKCGDHEDFAALPPDLQRKARRSIPTAGDLYDRCAAVNHVGPDERISDEEASALADCLAAAGAPRDLVAQWRPGS